MSETLLKPYRQHKEFWYVHNTGEVEKTTGYSCAPNNPSMWWCPSVGYSCCEGGSLFPTEREALVVSIFSTKKRLENEKAMLAKLSARLKEIG